MQVKRYSKRCGVSHVHLVALVWIMRDGSLNQGKLRLPMTGLSSSPALLPMERHWLVRGSNSSLSLGQMHRKLPSKFSHRASPHSAKLISHSFTSEKSRRGSFRSVKDREHAHGCQKSTWYSNERKVLHAFLYKTILHLFLHLSILRKIWLFTNRW